MKKVFTDISHIAHLWANQLQDTARNSGHNFYFIGDTIYSYGSHFPIAKHVKNKQGEKAVLFTERTYSNTTAKHIQVVRQAVNHLNTIYCYNPERSSHEDNFNTWIAEIEEISSKLLRARKPEKYLIQIERISERVKKYADFFSLKIPITLQKAMEIKDSATWREYSLKRMEYEKKEARKAKQKLQRQHKKELTDWLAGKTSRLYVRDGFDYVRKNEDVIETTQAVKIPLPVAERIYNKIQSGKLKAGDKILDFTVSQADENVICVGCHTFKTNYLIQQGQVLLGGFVNYSK